MTDGLQIQIDTMTAIGAAREKQLAKACADRDAALARVAELETALTLARTARADEPLTQRKAELAVIEVAEGCVSDPDDETWRALQQAVQDYSKVLLRSLDTSTGGKT